MGLKQKQGVVLYQKTFENLLSGIVEFVQPSGTAAWQRNPFPDTAPSGLVHKKSILTAKMSPGNSWVVLAVKDLLAQLERVGEETLEKVVLARFY